MEKTRGTIFTGFEIISHEWTMRAKLIRKIIFSFGALQLFVFGWQVYRQVTPGLIEICTKAYMAKLFASGGEIFNFQYKISDFTISGADLLESEFAIMAMEILSNIIRVAFMRSFFVWLLLAVPIYFFYKRTKKETEKSHVRGMTLQSEKQLRDKLKKEKSLLPLSEKICLPRRYESEHIFIAGKSRVGKSVQIKRIVSTIRERHLRACIYDFKGEYVQLFYNPEKDFILNPLDQRGASWNLFDELESRADLSAVVDSLIPQSSGDDKFWSAAARDVFRGILAALYEQGHRTNKALWQACTQEISGIAELLQTTESGAAGYVYIQDASSKQAAGVIAVLMSYISWLEYAQRDAGGKKISTKAFLKTPGAFLYLTGRPELEATLKPYTALFVDLLGRRLLSLPDAEHDDTQKTFFLLDEFGNMQKLPSVKNLLTAAGSKGGVVVIGIQDFAAMEKIYGQQDAKTIFNSCGTNLVLNVTDPSTAKIFSDRFGTYEYTFSSRSYRMAGGENSDNQTVSRQEKEKLLILPSEIQSLKKLTGYLKVPEHDPAYVQVSVDKIKGLQAVAVDFVAAAGFSLEDVAAKAGNKAVAAEAVAVITPTLTPAPAPETASAATTGSGVF